jgi:acyl-CoA synthetase (AMP-forming)/AMP-acid ligase II
MQKGFGTCIGKAVPGVGIKILKISDIPEVSLRECALGEVGEIVVQGLQVTPGYFDMPEEIRRSKITSDGKLWHRMGDVGRLDQDKNLWFLGRKVHRVETVSSTYFSIQMEAIFNQHPKIRRSALVKLKIDSVVVPGLVIERHDRSTRMSNDFFQELLRLKDTEEFTRSIVHFFLHPGLPVDVRHNIKIDRTRLSSWAQERLRSS